MQFNHRSCTIFEKEWVSFLEWLVFFWFFCSVLFCFCFFKACSLLVGSGDNNSQKNHDLGAKCFKYKAGNSVSVGGDDSSSAEETK